MISDAIWGDIVLPLSDLSTSRGRTLLVQEPARGEGGRLSDRGHVARRSQAQVLFVSQGVGDDPVERYRQLLSLDDGMTRLYTHPIDGQWPAKMSIDGEQITQGRVAVSLLFVEDRGDERSPRRLSQSPRPASVVQSVEQAAEQLASELIAVDESTAVPDQVRATAAGWYASERGIARSVQVAVEASRESAALASLIDEIDARGRLELFSVYTGIIATAAAIRRASQVLTAAAGRVIDLRVDRPVGLLALCARLYGAELAVERAEAVLQLNELRSGLDIPAGTTLKVIGA